MLLTTTAIIRKSKTGAGVILTLYNCEGLPLFASVSCVHDCADTAKRAVERYELTWYEPFDDAEADLLWIGERFGLI